jgi:ABC-type Fe3+-citrate transport system substrate-binding protein
MRKTLFILLIFAAQLAYGQGSKPTFFGLDLDSDWYSLTNRSRAQYALSEIDSSNKLPLVISDCDYSKNKLLKEFSDFDFTLLLLGFPKGYVGNFNQLKPEVFFAIKKYKNTEEYLNKSKNDISNMKKIISAEYGYPELNMINEKYSIFKWKNAYFEIILNSREEELFTQIMCLKQ